jgi:hypothetical protein
MNVKESDSSFISLINFHEKLVENEENFIIVFTKTTASVHHEASTKKGKDKLGRR